ncbi:TonB-dependent receptor plug domain-containing protein [uncultured Alistipes sp.]|uniref:TonB-dependent receptor plug domain-containing protein n=1 Tax=uncultured Alistipes sp. TaxID=538949 RepID=UPI00266D1319|nr:TonB-dependent receptor plug domain-containing protein [uncultured Alistipes sp.]
MKSYYSIVCAFLCAWMAVIPAFGQKIEVKGRITDASGVPLVGASIINVAEQTGRVSDADGAFAIEATPQTELQFSYLGYVSQTVVVGSRTFLEIVLQEQGNMMDDVVVIGYGTVQKKDLTGAIQSIGGEELVDAMNTNVSESLNGRVSGVLVNKSSNRPGADMSIQIRGVNSFNFSNEPLYVIDGVPSQSGMRHLNASDIESIDILKDASSCAIYGSRGANGVVIVTTKGGRQEVGIQP